MSWWPAEFQRAGERRRGRAVAVRWLSALLATIGSVLAAHAGTNPGAGSVAPGAKVLPTGRADYDVRRSHPRFDTPNGGDPEHRPGIAANHARQPSARPCDLPPHGRVDRHPLFGTPTYVGSTARLLTGRRGPGEVDPVAIVTEYVAAHRELFGLDALELSDARLSRNYVTKHNGVGHLTFQQQHDGIDVFGAVLRTGVTRFGEIISLGSTMLGRPPGGFQPPRFAISPIEAIRAAAAGAGIVASVDPQPIDGPTGLDRGGWFGKTADFAGPLEVRPLYFPLTRTELRPAWQVVVPVPGPGHVYEIIVDATDGALLWRRDRMRSVTTEDAVYRVYPSDSPAPGSPGRSAPDGYQFPFTASVLRTVLAAEIVSSSSNGWIDDGANQTQGNNVDAHTDLDNDDLPDLPRPHGDPYRTFDFLADPELDNPDVYREASVVQAFYVCNLYHDRLYGLGFDEVAGNFQLDNLGLGGVGGDVIQADVQDPGGDNSANFTTAAADGSPARLQLYLFTNLAPARDSALDSDLVFHELSHGLSIRLLGGLAGPQPAALGEGWSDFVAISLNAQAGDDPHGTYPFAAFLAYQRWTGFDDNYYFGLRRFPYSTDLNESPQTYADIDPAQQFFPPAVPRNPYPDNTADLPHNAGEIWCAALMECRAELMDRYGFWGNQLMLQLVVDGMKLAVANPNFLQARDAILQADQVNNWAANLDILWQAFAKRGLGFSASSVGNDTSGVVEAFDVPDMLVFSYPDGRPDILAPMADAIFPIGIQGLGQAQLVPGTERLHYWIDGQPVVTAALTQTGPNSYEATLPAAACLSRYDYYLSADQLGAGTVVDPPSAPASVYQATAVVFSEVLLVDDMEAQTGWVVGAIDDDAIKGIWERTDPEGTLAQPEDDHTPDPGTLCWVTDGRAGINASNYDVDGGKTTLTSPIFAVPCGDALVSYWRWYSNDAGPNPGQDVFTVSITNNGGASWVNAEVVGPSGSGTSGGWLYHEFVVTDFVPTSSQLQVRFVAEDAGGGSLVEAAVDDFQVTTFHCGGSSPGDIDNTANVDLADYAALYDCLDGPGAGVTATPPQCAGDCLSAFDADTDQDLDLVDLAHFQTLFGTTYGP